MSAGTATIKAVRDGEVVLSLPDDVRRDLETLVLNPETEYDTPSDALTQALGELIDSSTEGECPDCGAAVHGVSTDGPDAGTAFPCGHQMGGDL